MRLTYRQFWFRWIVYCGFGEMLSIAAAAAIAVAYHYGVGTPAGFWEGALYVTVMLAAGAFEGLILGSMQWSVLKQKYTFLKLSDWLGYTVSVTIISWALGIIPSMFYRATKKVVIMTETVEKTDTLARDTLQILPHPLPVAEITAEPSLWWIIFSSALLGLFLGALFGLFQWLALRKHSPRAAVWIPANALAWGIGMIWIFLAATLPDELTPIPLVVGMGAAGGILAGLSVGVITGWFLAFMPVFPQYSAEESEEELS